MVGLLIAIIVFNFVAFKTNKLSAKQIAHIWAFTIAFQMSFDNFIDVKYHAYWYFNKEISWADLPTHTVLIPPVNMMFLNWYPFQGALRKQVQYFVFWVIALTMYELLTLLPEPWGYFNYGWWNIWYSAVIDPILLSILLLYYKKFIK
ncbi:hypothetical protein ACFSTA_17410 [Ornithinibacillus salinisoli]|uniref:Uncharacterized protein n=1 Tax=Ornithinibacillus salinisoli TaxID=1848459 RepID=A0ABW4W296_9BACI